MGVNEYSQNRIRAGTFECVSVGRNRLVHGQSQMVRPSFAFTDYAFGDLGIFSGAHIFPCL